MNLYIFWSIKIKIYGYKFFLNCVYILIFFKKYFTTFGEKVAELTMQNN